MANMKLTKTAMSLQDAEIRCHNFEEVALGYKKEEAMEEAMRCLHWSMAFPNFVCRRPSFSMKSKV